MPILSVTGRDCTTKVVTADSDGTEITFAVPVKSFLIKPFGGTIYFKFKSTDADADRFRIDDGDSLKVDISVAYPIATSTSSVGFVSTASGEVTVYVLAAF